MSSAENDTHTGRLVVLTREQRDGLREAMFGDLRGLWKLLAPIVNAWDAAAVDPTEAVLDALEAVDVHVIGATAAVLAALGVPSGVSRDATQPTSES